jgi:nucleotide-binding universal stress UspA family protein
MENKEHCNLDELVERKIMIAVDGSANSKRAVQFVGDFFGCYPNITVILINIILEPAPGYFENDAKHQQWIAEQQAESTRQLDEYQRLLVDSGFAEDKVQIRIKCKQAPAIAVCILEEQAELKCCTVVIGRRGLSKKEEFIFGSTSNRILHEANNCAVMVIE